MRGGGWLRDGWRRPARLGRRMHRGRGGGAADGCAGVRLSEGGRRGGALSLHGRGVLLGRGARPECGGRLSGGLRDRRDRIADGRTGHEPHPAGAGGGAGGARPEDHEPLQPGLLQLAAPGPAAALRPRRRQPDGHRVERFVPHVADQIRERHHRHRRDGPAAGLRLRHLQERDLHLPPHRRPGTVVGFARANERQQTNQV